MSHENRKPGFPTDPQTNGAIGQTALYCLSLDGSVQIISHTNPLMVKRIKNDSESAIISAAIPVTNQATVKIADANPDRKFFHVHANGDSKPVWIKLQSANTDNDKKGIWVERKAGVNPFWQMPPDNIYTGEISAIADSIGVDVFVTEY